MTYGGGRVFIGGISSSVSKDDIGNEFSKFGKILTVWVASKPPGFAFVEYDDDRDAEEAVKSLNGVSLFNENKIRVEISKKRQSSGAPNRSGGPLMRGGPPPSRSNPNFRTGNTTSFKPTSRPRFSMNSSAPRSGASRYSQDGERSYSSRSRLPDGAPRSYGDSSNSRYSDQNSRFSSSRPSGESGSSHRFSGESGGRDYSSGYKSSGSSFSRSSRQMD